MNAENKIVHRKSSNRKSPIKVGVYGGSFNPVHYGHVGLAKWVMEHTDLDELWLMVSPLNPLKASGSANGLTSGFGELSKDQIREIIADCGFEPNVRGETLDIAGFARLAEAIRARSF
jgi:cytidyltransferase-like protein